MDRQLRAQHGPLEVRRCLPHRRGDDAVFIADLYSRTTGRPVAKVVERRPGQADRTTVLGREIHHGDGRQSAQIRTGTVQLDREQTEVVLGLPINDLRRMLYERERAAGVPSDEAVARLFPNGKVTA